VTEPTRVLLVTRTLGLGGTERQVVVLAKGLARRGFAPTVAVFYDVPTARREELEQARVQIADMRKRGRFDVLTFGFRAVRLARALRPTATYGFLAGPNLVALMMRLGSPQTRAVWGIRSTKLGAGDSGWWTRLVDWAQARLARLPSLIISNSAAARDEVVGLGYPADRVAVVPNGVDLERFRPDEGRRECTRSRFGVGDHAVVVAIVGRVHPMKDHATFLRAMGLLRPRVPQLSVWCIGHASAEERMLVEQLAASAGVGDVTLAIPAQDEIEAVYPALDLLVSASSHTEGTSNVLLEARASGVRCVATRVGDSAVVLGPDGVLVDPKDPPALAEACFSVLSQLPEERDAAAARARADVAARYSDDRMVDDTIGLIDRRVPCG
jgi:glycosyltransferase involved in cell wall biosynthesis